MSVKSVRNVVTPFVGEIHEIPGPGFGDLIQVAHRRIVGLGGKISAVVESDVEIPRRTAVNVRVPLLFVHIEAPHHILVAANLVRHQQLKERFHVEHIAVGFLAGESAVGDAGGHFREITGDIGQGFRSLEQYVLVVGGLDCNRDCVSAG